MHDSFAFLLWMSTPLFCTHTYTHDIATPTHPSPATLPDPSSFLPLPLMFGFGRVCPFLGAGFLEMFVNTFLHARPIKKAWRYVCLGVCVCVCVFVHVWVCTCALWLGCRV